MARVTFHQAFELRRLIDEYADALLCQQYSYDTSEQSAEVLRRYREAMKELNDHINSISGARMQHADGGWCRISRPGMFSEAIE